MRCDLTDRHAHTHGNHYNPRCACAPRVNYELAPFSVFCSCKAVVIFRVCVIKKCVFPLRRMAVLQKSCSKPFHCHVFLSSVLFCSLHTVFFLLLSTALFFLQQLLLNRSSSNAPCLSTSSLSAAMGIRYYISE